jgi:hypothetical protein
MPTALNVGGREDGIETNSSSDVGELGETLPARTFFDYREADRTRYGSPVESAPTRRPEGVYKLRRGSDGRPVQADHDRYL